MVSALCVVGSILVFLSTLFTKQHVIYDVLGGIAVAEIGYLAARWTKLPVLFERLNDRYKEQESAFEIGKLGDSFQMMTKARLAKIL